MNNLLRNIRLIYFSMLSSPLLIIFIYNIIVPDGTIMLNEEIDAILKFLIPIFALIFIPVGFLTYKKNRGKIGQKESSGENLFVIRKSLIKRMSFLCGVAIFSTVAYLLTLSNIYIIYTLVLIIPFVFIYPTKSRIEADFPFTQNIIDEDNKLFQNHKNLISKNPWIIVLFLVFMVFINYNSFKDLFNNKIVLPDIKIDNGILEDSIYTNQFLGWTLYLPNDYKPTPLEVLEKYSKKGNEILKTEPSSKEEEIRLLNVNNDFVNFRSSIIFRAFYPEISNEKDWASLFEKSLNKMANESITVEKRIENDFIIDSLNFHIIEFLVYGKNQIGIINISYVTNEFIIDFSMNYTDSEEAKKLLMRIKNSEFKNLKKYAP